MASLITFTPVSYTYGDDKTSDDYVIKVRRTINTREPNFNTITGFLTTTNDGTMRYSYNIWEQTVHYPTKIEAEFVAQGLREYVS